MVWATDLVNLVNSYLHEHICIYMSSIKTQCLSLFNYMQSIFHCLYFYNTIRLCLSFFNVYFVHYYTNHSFLAGSFVCMSQIGWICLHCCRKVTVLGIVISWLGTTRFLDHEGPGGQGIISKIWCLVSGYLQLIALFIFHDMCILLSVLVSTLAV